jgi:hypothetical protein
VDPINLKEITKMAADQGILDAVCTDNIKTVAGMGAWALAQVQAAYPGHAAFVQSMREKLLADVTNEKISIKDAIATGSALNDAATAKFAELVGQGSTSQQEEKAALTTPPETGVAAQLSTLAAGLSTVLALLQAQSNGPAPVAAKA